MTKLYLFDVSKIIEAAYAGDLARMAAYVNQLCDRLESDGEADAAKRLRKRVKKDRVSNFGIARAGNEKPAKWTTSLPVDSESRMPTADEESYERGSVELFLSEQAGSVLEKFLAYYRAADRLVAKGVGVSPRMLIYGPPGCGKTQLARYVAAEVGLPLVTARVDGLISSYLGSTAKNVRSLFEHAILRPCVFFLDEFDALAKMRDDGRELGELKRVVISLLQNIDAMGNGHILLAATNHEHLLDPAIWRRFAYKMKLSEPDGGSRAKMARKFFGRFATEQLIDLLVPITEGISGGQIKFLAEDCIRRAVLAECDAVDVKDAIESALSMNQHTASFAQGSIADRMKALHAIDRKRFTQTRLARIFGVAQSHVSQLLRSP